MHKLRLDVLDNNPFNDPKYVKQRLLKDGVKIKPYRDIVDEEDYLEMLPGLINQQAQFEDIIKEMNLDETVEELSKSVRFCRF